MSFLTHCTFRSSKVTSQSSNAALGKLFLQESKLSVTPFLSHDGISERGKTTPVNTRQPFVNNLSIDTDTIRRMRVRLIAENLCPRQQVLVLRRRPPQPRLGNAPRRFWDIACRRFSSWRGSPLVVKPETVLRWRRRGVAAVTSAARRSFLER
jgi:hypothetical protein